jgi:cytochrome c553
MGRSSELRFEHKHATMPSRNAGMANERARSVGRRVSAAAGWTLMGLAPAILVLDAVLPPAVAADLAYGEYLASECVICHRATVGQGAIPAIAGLPAPYFVNALRDYRAGRRLNPIMQNVARSLDDEQIAALAAYFASLKAGGPES